MENEQIVYLLWIVASILTFILGGYSLLLFAIIFWFIDNKIKKENPTNANKLMWISIGLVFLLGLIQLLIFMSFANDNFISRIYCTTEGRRRECGSLLSRFLK